MIPPRFLNELRDRLTISEVIGKRMSLKRAGREFKGCCPFHKEKTPSFTVNDDKQFFHCFGCGEHGDVLNFVMKHDNLPFMDAVQLLAADAGMQVPKPDPKAARQAEKAKTLHDMMDEAASWMQGQLYDSANAEILNYVRGRGLNEDTMKSFRIGFAPADRRAIIQFLKAQGYSESQMMEAGLIRKSGKTGEPYAFFRERVMFPVINRRGQVVAFGGRVLPDSLRIPDQSDFTPPKYLNSSDTTLFDKGRMLYAENTARQAARDGHTLIVTEGYMDVIACYQAGFKGALAPMGTALTEDQITALWSMMVGDEKSPVLCFDGDSAGQAAAGRACERVLPLLKPGCSMRFAFLPQGEDPDSLVKSKGPAALQAVLKSSLSLFDFLWTTHIAGRDIKTPEMRAGAINSLENAIKKIADRNIQSHYRQLLRTKVSETFFPKRDFTKKADGLYRANALKPRAPVHSDLPPRVLLAALINHPDIFEEVEEYISGYQINETGLRALRDAVIDALIHTPDLDAAALQTHLLKQGFSEALETTLSDSVYRHAVFARPRQKEGDESELNVREMWIKFWKNLEQNAINQEIRMGWKAAFQSSDENQEEKLRELLQIKNTNKT